MIKRAIRPHYQKSIDSQQDTPSYVLIDKNVRVGNYSATCNKCGNKRYNWSEKQRRYGAAVSVNVTCPTCNKNVKSWSSQRVQNKGKFDVNMKMVDFALKNQGYKTIQDYEMIFNTKIMASSTFYRIAKIIEERGMKTARSP